MKYCHRDQLTAVGLSMSSDNSIQLSFKQTLVSREDNWRERKIISMLKHIFYFMIPETISRNYFHDCVCWAHSGPHFLRISGKSFHGNYQLKD